MLAVPIYVILLTGQEFKVFGFEGKWAGICMLEGEAVEGGLT